ncbi:MAG: alpha/beta hydrolase [Bauldia sp.]|nr:alpha/beta hydrolase [Bauldia sp.]
MTEARAERLTVGANDAKREIAVIRRDGATSGLFWLGGFRSEMTGTKATAVDAYAAAHGLAATRFDYSGHGQSGGSFEDGTISRWLEEARVVFDRLTSGRQIVVGSSMGGWIALLLAEALRGTGRVGGLVLIAPAVDMTRALMWDRWSKRAQKTLMTTGVYHESSDYSDEPYPITRALIEDGDRHLFGERLIEVGCPVHILQGMLDRDVPWRHAQHLVARLASDDVVLTLVKDGDHRLSRPEDIERLNAAIEGLIAEMSR